MQNNKIRDLEIYANKIRLGALESVYFAQSGHLGGSLSIAEILSVLYFDKMRIRPKQPQWPERDRFVLSKGHGAPALYAALALAGHFGLSELRRLRRLNSFLQGHPDMNKIPGVDMSTGSLGQGLSVACGMALHSQYRNKGIRVYCILGDGELGEGQIWEAVMSAAHYSLSQMTVFVDVNGLQIDGSTQQIMKTDPLDKKFSAFGWHVDRVNGHDIGALMTAIDAAHMENQPSVILCDTIKGKGVSFMENQVGWHGVPPNAHQYIQAINEIKEKLGDIK